MRILRLLSPAAALLVLAACGQPSPQNDAGTTDFCAGKSTPSVQVGTGQSAFEPLTDGQSVPIIHGPQGGYHIWGAVRTCGLALQNAEVTYAVEAADGSAVYSSTPTTLTLSAVGSGGEWYGMIGLLPDPEQARNKQTRLKMTVKDSTGATATDSKVVLPQ